MNTFIVIIVVAAVGYFIYTRVQKARARRDATDLGVSGRSKGNRVEP